MSRQRAALPHLHPGWFSIVMGLAGLSLAWHRAQPLMGAPAQAIALAVGGAAVLAFLGLSALSLLRAWRHPEAWREDLQHPVRHPFVAAIPIALLLSATVAVAWVGPHPLARAAWWLGSVAQLVVTAWVLARWWRPAASGGLTWAGVTPALFIPIVGNVVVPLAGVPLGHADWSAAQFGIGLVFWLPVLALIGARVATQGLWPERLRPTAFIIIAPPAVIGLGALQLGAPPLLAWMAWGAAAFGLLWAGTLTKGIAAQPFALPHWSLSFPLAALAALTLRLATPGSAMAVLGPALLALASLVVLALLLGTLRGLRDGSLLAPEPVAFIVAAAP